MNPDPEFRFKISEIMSEQFDGDKSFYNSFPIDSEKLATFVVPTINFRQIIDGVTSYISEPMVRCSAKDFEDRGYVFKSENDRIKATFRFCPNWDKLEFLKVKNSYTDNKERYSFSIEIHQCNRREGNCQTA